MYTACPNILKVNHHDIKAVEHCRCGFAVFPVETVYRNFQQRVSAAFPLDHVILGLA